MKVIAGVAGQIAGLLLVIVVPAALCFGAARLSEELWPTYTPAPTGTQFATQTPLPSSTPWPPGYDPIMSPIETILASTFEAIRQSEATVFAAAIEHGTPGPMGYVSVLASAPLGHHYRGPINPGVIHDKQYNVPTGTFIVTAAGIFPRSRNTSFDSVLRFVFWATGEMTRTVRRQKVSALRKSRSRSVPDGSPILLLP